MAIEVALADLPADELASNEVEAGEGSQAEQGGDQEGDQGGEQLPGLGEGVGEGFGEGAGETEVSELPAEPQNAEPPTVESLQQQLADLRKQVAAHAEFDQQISELSVQVEKQAAEVLACESRVESAKADLKYEREEYDTRVRELRKLVADRNSGQGHLPFDRPAVTGGESGGAKASATESATEMVEAVIDGKTIVPDEHSAKAIINLGQKAMIALVGQDEWQYAKDRDQPFGMTDKELAVLEQHDIFTIGHLEQRMRDDAYWHQNIRGFGETKVSKLIESLRVWRGKFPMPADS